MATGSLVPVLRKLGFRYWMHVAGDVKREDGFELGYGKTSFNGLMALSACIEATQKILPDVTNDRAFVKRPRKVFQIATTSGNALFASDWSNADQAKLAFTRISASTADAPALRNPNVALVPFLIGCLAIAGLLMALYFWLTGE